LPLSNVAHPSAHAANADVSQTPIPRATDRRIAPPVPPYGWP